MCKGDGTYYSDDTSFMMCTNGEAYMMKCPVGTKNSQVREYKEGAEYTTRNFCDIIMDMST